MPACAQPCCADSPNSPTLAKLCCADSPDLPTLDNPCRASSPDSPTLDKPCRADSPDLPTLALASFWEKCDSPRHICASNAPVLRIWREWPLLSGNANLYQEAVNDQVSHNVCFISPWGHTKLGLICRSKYCCSKSINLGTRFAGHSSIKSSTGELLHMPVRWERGTNLSNIC